MCSSASRSGNYDRLLDFSRAVTGTLFFVPTATFLEDFAPGAAAPSTDSSTATEGESAAPSEPQPSEADGSLGVGSLKKEAGRE
jgi:putative iron-dependent peroxidase